MLRFDSGCANGLRRRAGGAALPLRLPGSTSYAGRVRARATPRRDQRCRAYARHRLAGEAHEGDGNGVAGRPQARRLCRRACVWMRPPARCGCRFATAAPVAAHRIDLRYFSGGIPVFFANSLEKEEASIPTSAAIDVTGSEVSISSLFARFNLRDTM